MSLQEISLSTIMTKCQGLIQIKPKIRVHDGYTLSLVYTPGVGESCLEIQKNPDLIYDYTMAVNSVAIVTDGSAFDIKHPNELLPKLESQVALFKFFYNIDAFPFILDTNECKTIDDMIMVLDNLSPVYKVIDLRFINSEKIKQLLPKLKERNLQVTVLYKSLWEEMKFEDENNKLNVKNYMNALIVEAAVLRAILDARAFIPPGSGPLHDLVHQTWIKTEKELNELPVHVVETLMHAYMTALNFLYASKLNHPSVDNKLNDFITRQHNFYTFGKNTFTSEWGKNHLLKEHSTNQNSLLLHKRFQGMISIAPKFKPRSLQNLYELFIHSYENDDIKHLEEKIRADPNYADVSTYKRNLAAIITNGTAVLGLGDIGPSAGLPVMEGKSVLFKTLGGIDLVPICIKEKNVDKAVHVMKMLAPIFSAINLEDIKAPECFDIERRMIEETNIPVMHDDQHGTAVVCLAAILNGLKLMNKKPSPHMKVVINGAGSAGIAICELLMGIGLTDIIICDTEGAIYEGRQKNMNDFKNKIAKFTNQNKKSGTLAEVIKETDVFIGVSAAGALKPEMVKSMNKDPFILALANPVPEILPDEARKAGAFIVATGRSDFKNQVNNSLAFPGIFRAAIDTKAKKINTEMKLAAAYAIADLVDFNDLSQDYILPNALNADVPSAVAKAVADAAIKTGVAQRLEMTGDQVHDYTRKLNMEGGLIPQL